MNGDIVAQRYAKALSPWGSRKAWPSWLYGKNLSALKGSLKTERAQFFHPCHQRRRKEESNVIPTVDGTTDVLTLPRRSSAAKRPEEHCQQLPSKPSLLALKRCSASSTRKPQQRAAGWHPCQTRKANQQTDRAEVRSDPSILGKVVLQVGDNVLDASLELNWLSSETSSRGVNRSCISMQARSARSVKEQIQNYEQRVDATETGTVLSVGDGIARVYGVQNAMSSGASRVPRRTAGHGAQPGRRQRG